MPSAFVILVVGDVIEANMVEAAKVEVLLLLFHSRSERAFLGDAGDGEAFGTRDMAARAPTRMLAAALHRYTTQQKRPAVALRRIIFGIARFSNPILPMSASLIGRLGQALSGYPPRQCRCRFSNRPSGSSTFRLSATPVSMSLL
jgi:hypothetical protein